MNAFGGGYDFSTLATTGVERVEVVRGPQSALFGADALGGVVQVVTRSGGAPWAEATLEGGSVRHAARDGIDGAARTAAGRWGGAGGALDERRVTRGSRRQLESW